MAADALDKFLLVGNPGTATTLSAPGYTIGNTSVTVGSTTNFPTTTGVIFAIDQAEVVGGEEVRIDGTYCVFSGKVASGTSISNLALEYGTAQDYPAGALTRVYITVSAIHNKRLIEGLTAQHSQLDGSHTAVTTTSINNSGALTQTGASTLTGALTIKSYDGYITSTDTWTYVSATSFKITGSDVTAKFPVGTKIKLTQTTAKYFYVISSSFSTDTTVNVYAGTDYTLVNAAIIAPSYSYDAIPQAFPQWFAFTPAITAGTGTFTSVAASGKFAMNGKSVVARANIIITTNGTAAGNIIIALPVTANATSIMIGHGRGHIVSGVSQQIAIQSDAAKAAIWNNSGGYGGASGETILAFLAYDAA